MLTDEQWRRQYLDARRKRVSSTGALDRIDAVNEAARRVSAARGPLVAAQEAGWKRAEKVWERAHPMPVLPPLPRWPRWRRELVRQKRDRLRAEYIRSSDRQRFLRQASQAAGDELRATVREMHGVDLDELIEQAVHEKQVLADALHDMHVAATALYRARCAGSDELLIEQLAEFLGVPALEVKQSVDDVPRTTERVRRNRLGGVTGSAGVGWYGVGGCDGGGDGGGGGI